MKKYQLLNPDKQHDRMTRAKMMLPVFYAALLFALTGCFTHTPKDFTPKSGQVCDEMIITGTFYNIGQLDGVWINDVKVPAAFERFPAANGPLRIKASIPEGIQTGLVRVKISTGWGWVLGVLGNDVTFSKPYTVTGSPAVPAIESFTVNPVSIKEGESATLSWQLSPAVTSIGINGVSTPLTPNTKTVSPTQTTTYTLRAHHECLVRSREVTINVIQLPKITSTDKTSYRPGENLKANGVGLKRTGEVSKLIFKQGANVTEITDGSPTSTQLNAAVPLTLAPGTATVQAKVGNDLSNEKSFTVDARENGPFIEIRSTVNMTMNKSCNTKSMEISINPPGRPFNRLASFTQGLTILAQHNFTEGPISGACFSPKCDQAVSLHFRPLNDDYLAVIERFGTPSNYLLNNFTVKIMDGFNTVPERWHCLFSADDKLVILSTSASGGKMSYIIHDMERKLNIAQELGIPCTGCALEAKVIDGTKVQVTVNGGSFIKTHLIF